jgi:8-oxo-dGDP phosphatase
VIDAPYPGGQWHGEVKDEPLDWPISKSRTRFDGAVWDVRTDTVDIDGHSVDRDYVVHTGAVAVVALDEDQRVYLLRQYRHPVGMALFEVPAGLLDIDGEDALHTAQRELAEEAGLQADQWHVLVDFFTSPGGLSEAIRIYLARGLTARDGGRVQTGEAEEVDMPAAWVPLSDACDKVLCGDLQNPTTVVGVLAAQAASRNNWGSLRPADAVWPARDHLMQTHRVRTNVTPHRS